MVLTKEQAMEKIKTATPLELELVFIPLIMRNQTQEERATLSTREHNGKGLNAFDATSISFYHELIKSGNHLNQYQIDKAREKLIKYAGQFAEMTREPVNNTPA